MLVAAFAKNLRKMEQHSLQAAVVAVVIVVVFVDRLNHHCLYSPVAVDQLAPILEQFVSVSAGVLPVVFNCNEIMLIEQLKFLNVILPVVDLVMVLVDLVMHLAYWIIVISMLHLHSMAHSN